jgi:hypothetical protein
MRDRWLFVAALVLGLASPHPARAHIASNGFLVVSVTGQDLSGSMELAVRDAELAVGVDENRDGKITWGELKAAELRLNRYLGEHLTVSAQNRHCEFSFGAMQVNERVDGVYVWLPLIGRCPCMVRDL